MNQILQLQARGDSETEVGALSSCGSSICSTSCWISNYMQY